MIIIAEEEVAAAAPPFVRVRPRSLALANEPLELA